MSAANPTAWIAQLVFEEMLQLAEQHTPLETGGMLLGYEVDGESAVVTKIIGPGPQAKHGRFRFTPDGAYQQAEIERHYWATNGRETYLGDWHTHPRNDSTPSPLDKRTLARIALEPAPGTARPLMAILACGSGHWRLGIVRFLCLRRRFLWAEYQLAQMQPKCFSP